MDNYTNKIIKALKHPSPIVRTDAAWLLGQKKEKKAVRELILALEENKGDPYLLSIIAESLGYIGESDALPVLYKLLHSSFLPVRVKSAEALSQIGNCLAIPYLKAALGDSNVVVRKAVKAALEKLTKKMIGGENVFKRHITEKDDLFKVLDELADIAAQQENQFAIELLKETKERLSKEVFTLVILGEFKRGKSTFINALLGESLLPTAIIPLTAIPTIIQHNNTHHDSAKVIFLNGDTQEIGIDEIIKFVTEKENPANQKLIREVQVGLNNPFLQQGVVIVDTPGVGSVYEHNTGAAYAYLPRSDAGIFIISVDAPLSKTEINYLKDVRKYVHKLFFVLNKCDVASQNDIQEALTFTHGILKDIFEGQEIQLLPISARLALEGKIENNRQKLLTSGMQDFEEKLNSFIELNKSKLIREITCARSLRILSELELELKIFYQAIQDTEQGLNEKIGRFNNELARLEQEREDSIYLLYREVDRLRKEVENNMSIFCQQKDPYLIQQLEEFAGSLKAHSPRDAALLLKKQVQDIVRNTLEQKRMEEKEILEEKFKSVAHRFFNRIENIVDQLMDMSAEIFQVRFEKTSSKEYILGSRGFYFHFADHPTFVPLLEDLPAMGILPGKILRRHLINRAKKMLSELFERNCGRVRESLAEGLKEEVRDVAGELRLRSDAVAKGLNSALQKALTQKQASREQNEMALLNWEKQNQCLQKIKETLKRLASYN